MATLVFLWLAALPGTTTMVLCSNDALPARMYVKRLQTNSFGRLTVNQTDTPRSFAVSDLQVLLRNDWENSRSFLLDSIVWKQSNTSRVDFRFASLLPSNHSVTIASTKNQTRTTNPWVYFGHVDTLNPLVPSMSIQNVDFCHSVRGTYCSLGMRLHHVTFQNDNDGNNTSSHKTSAQESFSIVRITQLALDVSKICTNSFGLVYCHASLRYDASNNDTDIENGDNDTNNIWDEEYPMNIHEWLETNICPGVASSSELADVSYNCSSSTDDPSQEETWLEINGHKELDHNNNTKPVWLDMGGIETTRAYLELSSFTPGDRSNNDPALRVRTLLPWQAGQSYILNQVDPVCQEEHANKSRFPDRLSSQHSLVVLDINGTRCSHPPGVVHVFQAEQDVVTGWPRRLALDVHVQCPMFHPNATTVVRVRYRATNDEPTATNRVAPTVALGEKSHAPQTRAVLLQRSGSVQSFRRLDVQAIAGNISGAIRNRIELDLDGYYFVLQDDNATLSTGYQALNQILEYSDPNNSQCTMETLRQTRGLHFYGRLNFFCTCFRRRWSVLIHELEYNEATGQFTSLAMDFHIVCSRVQASERLGWIRLNSMVPLKRIPVPDHIPFWDCVRNVHFDIVENSNSLPMPQTSSNTSRPITLPAPTNAPMVDIHRTTTPTMEAMPEMPMLTAGVRNCPTCCRGDMTVGFLMLVLWLWFF